MTYDRQIGESVVPVFVGRYWGKHEKSEFVQSVPIWDFNVGSS